MYGTFWALLPPIIAIVLALITKEAYSSLFIGVLIGAMFCAGFSPISTLDTALNDGLIAAIADNAGIFLFLVLLGIIVALVNMSGGSAAFGRWAETHIKTRVGAILGAALRRAVPAGWAHCPRRGESHGQRKSQRAPRSRPCGRGWRRRTARSGCRAPRAAGRWHRRCARSAASLRRRAPRRPTKIPLPPPSSSGCCPSESSPSFLPEFRRFFR